jgi:hypothetical protein
MNLNWRCKDIHTPYVCKNNELKKRAHEFERAQRWVYEWFRGRKGKGKLDNFPPPHSPTHPLPLFGPGVPLY